MFCFSLSGRLTLKKNSSAFSPFVIKTITLLNIVLRFVWMVSLIPPKTLGDDGQLRYTFGRSVSIYLTPATAMAEILRRTMWSLLRLEAEHQKTRVPQLEEEEEGGKRGGGGTEIGRNKSSLDKMPMSPAPVGLGGGGGQTSMSDLSLENRSDEQIIFELVGYSFLFAIFGFYSTIQNL